MNELLACINAQSTVVSDPIALGFTSLKDLATNAGLSVSETKRRCDICISNGKMQARMFVVTDPVTQVQKKQLFYKSRVATTAKAVKK